MSNISQTDRRYYLLKSGSHARHEPNRGVVRYRAGERILMSTAEARTQRHRILLATDQSDPIVTFGTVERLADGSRPDKTAAANAPLPTELGNEVAIRPPADPDESDADSALKSILANPVAEIADTIQALDDPADITMLRDAESSSTNRADVLRALDHRLATIAATTAKSANKGRK